MSNKKDKGKPVFTSAKGSEGAEIATLLQTTPALCASGPLQGFAVLPWVADSSHHPCRSISRRYGLGRDARRWMVSLLSSADIGTLRGCQGYAIGVGRPGDSYRFSSYMRQYCALGLVRKVGSRWQVTDQGAAVLAEAYAGILAQWGILHSVLPEGEAKTLVAELIRVCGGDVSSMP